MRTKAALPIVLALALCGCGQGWNTDTSSGPSSATATAAPPVPPPPPGPHRRRGLWEMRVSTEGLDAVERTRICLDDASDRQIALWGAQATGGCNHNEVVRQPDGSWRFRASCWLGSGGQLSTSGTVTGDLSNHYIVRAETTRSAAEAPQLNRSYRVTTEAQRLGDCPAGWGGGDMTVGPMRVNALQVGRRR